MPKRQRKINVFEYTDYRKYLLDYYTEQKDTKKHFSYRYFARKAGINSIGLYKDVLEGRQSLGRALVQKFSVALGHNKLEAEYFENMVFFCEARSVEEQRTFFERMISCLDSKAVKIDLEKYKYFTHWYYSAVRSLISMVEFKGDYKYLATRLSPEIKEQEAENAVKTLEVLGLILRDQDGTYKLTDELITTGNLSLDSRVHSMQVINFQKVMCDLGKEAYDRHPTGTMDMSTLTLGISERTYHAMKAEIAALRKKLSVMAKNDDSPDRVYQLNYQFFPLSKITEER